MEGAARGTRNGAVKDNGKCMGRSGHTRKSVSQFGWSAGRRVSSEHRERSVRAAVLECQLEPFVIGQLGRTSGPGAAQVNFKVQSPVTSYFRRV